MNFITTCPFEIEFDDCPGVRFRLPDNWEPATADEFPGLFTKLQSQAEKLVGHKLKNKPRKKYPGFVIYENGARAFWDLASGEVWD